MHNRKFMPFFRPQLVAHAALMGALASGCAAGGGNDDGPVADDPTFAAPSAPTTPRSPAVNNPSPTAPAAAQPSTTSPVTSAPVATTPAVNPDEFSPAPARQEDAAPADGDEDTGANAPPANDDDDDGGDEDSDDDGGDDDDDDDDEGGDDDSDDDDTEDDDDDEDDEDDDDDDDDTGATPPDPGTPPVDPGTPPPADAVTFSADIRPILVTNCGRCHASGGLPQFASDNAATGYDVAFSERNSIVSEIRSGNMPADTCNGAPGSDGCVSVADFNLIQQWVAAGAPE
jgi:hypothetical protein